MEFEGLKLQHQCRMMIRLLWNTSGRLTMYVVSESGEMPVWYWMATSAKIDRYNKSIDQRFRYEICEEQHLKNVSFLIYIVVKILLKTANNYEKLNMQNWQ